MRRESTGPCRYCPSAVSDSPNNSECRLILAATLSWLASCREAWPMISSARRGHQVLAVRGGNRGPGRRRRFFGRGSIASMFNLVMPGEKNSGGNGPHNAQKDRRQDGQSVLHCGVLTDLPKKPVMQGRPYHSEVCCASGIADAVRLPGGNSPGEFAEMSRSHGATHCMPGRCAVHVKTVEQRAAAPAENAVRAVRVAEFSKGGNDEVPNGSFVPDSGSQRL